jgi:hypothetical protein
MAVPTATQELQLRHNRISFGPLHFDERGNAVLIEKEMVNGPPVCRGVAVRDAGLSLDQQPPRRPNVIELVARQNTGMFGKQPLRQIL